MIVFFNKFQSILRADRKRFLEYFNLFQEKIDKEYELNQEEFKKLNDGYNDYEEDFLSQQELLNSFRDLFFESFAIWLFSYLDKQLKELCNKLQERCHLALRLSDMTGRDNVKKVKVYIEKACRLSLPAPDLWEPLCIFSKVRNTLVHSDKITKEIQKLVEDGKIEGIALGNGKIFLSQVYCKNITDLVFEYLNQFGELVYENGA